MASMTISLPEKTKLWVEKQVRRGRFANTSEYIRDLLIREEQRVASVATLQRELDKGRVGGISETLVDEVFAEARKRGRLAVKARHAS